MNEKEISSTALSFIGDAVYSLEVRTYYVSRGYHQGKKLQELSKRYVSAAGQTKVFRRLQEKGFFSEKEIEVFKRGRNAITHIPKNGDRITYETASGLEALCGYWYLFNPERQKEFYALTFEGGEENE